MALLAWGEIPKKEQSEGGVLHVQKKKEEYYAVLRESREAKPNKQKKHGRKDGS
jgi:hypothetical protein